MIVIRTTSPAAAPPSIQSALLRYRREVSGDGGAVCGASSDRTSEAHIDPDAWTSQPAATSAAIPAGTKRSARPSVSTCHEP